MGTKDREGGTLVKSEGKVEVEPKFKESGLVTGVLDRRGEVSS